jgi:hypothetical protein
VDISYSSWLVILLALCAANLPFINNRLFGVVLAGHLRKPFWLRLLEMAMLYALVGAIAYLLESHAGNVFTQGWEFYAVTACLFIVFAFPGFVYRYLRKHHG